MNQRQYSSDGEFGMAIAAAAYAISSLEGDSTQKKRISFQGPKSSLPGSKSRSDDNKIKLTTLSGSFKRLFTDREAKEDEISSGSRRFESGKETKPGSRVPSIKKPPMSSIDNKTYGKLGGKSMAEAKAVAWQNAKMTKIKNRYNKMISLIAEWENEKKAKAKHRLELKESESEQKQARALQTYGEEIKRIEKVASEARAMAEERRRNDEAKAREKARQIRLTGKTPHACCRFCG